VKIVLSITSFLALSGLAIGLVSSFSKNDTQSLKVSNAATVSFERGSYKIVKEKDTYKTQISEKRLRQILSKVGFKEDALDMAVAIAYYESTFRPMALNRSSNCYGLFQINMTGDLGKSRREKYGLSKNEDLFNPVINASIAYKMSNGGKNWSAWTTKDLAEAKVNG